MKYHFLFMLLMTSFILSCGDNNSGQKKDKQNRATVMVSNGNTSSECSGLGYGLIAYGNQYYEFDYNNQQFMNVVYQLMNQAMYGGYGNTSYQNYNDYNNNYNNYSNYRISGQDNCSVHYTMEFQGAVENSYNSGWGATSNYGGSILRIDSFRFI